MILPLQPPPSHLNGEITAGNFGIIQRNIHLCSFTSTTSIGQTLSYPLRKVYIGMERHYRRLYSAIHEMIFRIDILGQDTLGKSSKKYRTVVVEGWNYSPDLVETIGCFGMILRYNYVTIQFLVNTCAHPVHILSVDSLS